MGTKRRGAGRRAALALGLSIVASVLALVSAGPGAAAAQEPERVVDVIAISGAVDRAYAAYLTGEIRAAERAGHAAVVLRLVGSGSVKVDDATLVATVRDARIPVATWVGPVPLGQQESVAGIHTALWLAGDVRFVANGARVRSLRPLARGGSRDPGRPLEADVGAVPLPPELLTAGGELSERAVLERGLAAFVPRRGPDDSGGRIADGTVNALPDVVRALDGRVVELPTGRQTLSFGALETLTIRNANPGLVTKVRQALGTNPTLVYLLLLSGVGAVVFELFQPGFGPAGYAGGLLVLLAAYGLTALPTSPWGLALLIAGLAGLTVDVARGGLGWLTWGGALALGFGSFALVHSDGPALRVPWPWIAVGVVGSLVFYVVVMTVVLRALRGQTAQLGQALLGRRGEVRSTLNPQGHVLVEGALWRARALEWEGAVQTGTAVTVTGVDREALILDVHPV